MTEKPTQITEIHEHKAPTDESIRLLMEMEEKLIKRIIYAGPVKVANLEGSVVHMRNHMGGSTMHVSLAIEQGKRLDIPVEFSHTNLLHVGEYTNYFVEKVSEEIAKKLLSVSADVNDFVREELRR